MDKKGIDWRKVVRYAIRWLLPLVLTVLLVSYMFRKVDFKEVWYLVTHGVDYWWILLAMGISIISHIARALRWRLQLRALGINPPFMALCCSIFGTYSLNLVFPRLGEVWRCSYISRREKAPFSEVVGSMMGDRVADMITVMLLTLLAFLLATPALEAFLIKYPIGRSIVSLARNPWLWIGIAGVILLIWSIFHIGSDYTPIARTRQWISRFWHGFAVIGKMKGKGEFLFWSIVIWGCYYIQLYVAFYAFDFTRALCSSENAWGLTPCLVTFVLSSLSMAIPSNAGLGPWNIAIMFGLAIYGVSDPQGSAFSILQWSGQTVMLILLGIFTMIYIAITGMGRDSRMPDHNSSEYGKVK